MLQSQCHGFLANLIDTSFFKPSKHFDGTKKNLLLSTSLKLNIKKNIKLF